jgi:hypothetical protein
MLRRTAVSILVAISLLGTLARSYTRPLWHDEIFTLYLARLHDLRSLWLALLDGVDLNPPAYYVLVHYTLRFIDAESVAVRLPAALGFSLMLLSTWAFVGTRLGLAAGGLAAALVSLSGAGVYAYEGRPYGLILGCAAVAGLAWQRAALSRRRSIWLVTIALTLALALSAHYYAVLLLMPLALGEATNTVVDRKVDTPVWVAIVSPLAVFIVWWPLVLTARSWSARFWARPSLPQVLDVYRHILESLALPLVLSVAGAAVAVTIVRSWRPSKTVGSRLPRAIPLPELVFLVSLLALPIIGWVVAWSLTGAWHERYFIPWVIGFAGLVAISVHESGVVVLHAVAAVILALFVARESVRVVEWRHKPDVVPMVSLADREGQRALPILVSDGVVFVQLAHYAPPTLASRLWYPLKSPALIAKTGTDTESRAVEGLARFAGLHVEPLPDFLTKHPRFVLFGPHSWVVDALVSSGATLELKSRADELNVYEVRTAPLPQ